MKEELIQGASTEKDSVLLVDIGGGWGHDIVAFQKKYPTNGRLILQDLPAVIKDARTLPPGIEAQGYDFFTTQPVKGERYLHFICSTVFFLQPY